MTRLIPAAVLAVAMVAFPPMQASAAECNDSGGRRPCAATTPSAKAVKDAAPRAATERPAARKSGKH